MKNEKQGLNIDALVKAGRVGIVDGLTGLFTGDAPPTSQAGDTVLQSAALADVKTQLETAMDRLRASKKVLVMDGLDALVAMAPESGGAGSSASLAAEKLLLSLREVCFVFLSLPYILFTIFFFYLHIYTDLRDFAAALILYRARHGGRLAADTARLHDAGEDARGAGAGAGARRGRGGLAAAAGYGRCRGRERRDEGWGWEGGAVLCCCRRWREGI